MTEMDDAIVALKKKTRKEIRELKEKITSVEKIVKSSKIFEEIEKLASFRFAKTIMVYWSMPDEVYTHDFILKWSKKKQIILPVVTENGLDLKVFSGTDNMEASGAFGILEPSGESFTKKDEIDMVIVPGIAFDNNNNRLGRGKAYYDNLLPSLKAEKIGVCFDFQIIEKIPVSVHDIKVDKVISG